MVSLNRALHCLHLAKRIDKRIEYLCAKQTWPFNSLSTYEAVGGWEGIILQFRKSKNKFALLG